MPPARRPIDSILVVCASCASSVRRSVASSTISSMTPSGLPPVSKRPESRTAERIAVAAAPVGVDAERAPGVADAIDERQERVGLLVDVGQLHADQRLGRRVAEHRRERRVAFEDGAVDVAAADAVHGVREQLAVARLGDVQRLLLRARRPRAEAQQQRHRLVAGLAVGDRRRLDADVDQRAVVAAQRHGGLEQAAGVAAGGQPLAQARSVRREIAHRGAGAQRHHEVAGRGVRRQHPAALVGERHRLGQRSREGDEGVRRHVTGGGALVRCGGHARPPSPATASGEPGAAAGAAGGGT